LETDTKASQTELERTVQLYLKNTVKILQIEYQSSSALFTNYSVSF